MGFCVDVSVLNWNECRKNFLWAYTAYTSRGFPGKVGLSHASQVVEQAGGAVDPNSYAIKKKIVGCMLPFLGFFVCKTFCLYGRLICSTASCVHADVDAFCLIFL